MEGQLGVMGHFGVVGVVFGLRGMASLSAIDFGLGSKGNTAKYVFI